jgi:BlaI family penicillinase repressor
MNENHFYDGELKVMELLWENESLPAKFIAKTIKEGIGWEKNTTYTVLKRLIDKGVVGRIDPGFSCKALISKQQAQKQETKTLLDKMYNGSLSHFFSSFLKDEKLSDEEIVELMQIIKKNQ